MSQILVGRQPKRRMTEMLKKVMEGGKKRRGQGSKVQYDI